MDDKSEQPSDPSGNEESDVTLVGFFLVTFMTNPPASVLWLVFQRPVIILASDKNYGFQDWR